MVSKPERHLGERLRHPRRRLVRSGEEFDLAELERGEIELELPGPTPESGEEGREPWGFRDEDGMPPEARERLRLYRDFLDGRGYDRSRDERGGDE
jgi:hypothetical protein